MKFGWGPIGRDSAVIDAAHFRAAREGLGADAYLMIDLGTVWGEDVSVARERLAALKEVNAYWLEEPFTNMALGPYGELAKSEPRVRLAAGEGCNNYVQAAAMLDYAGLGFIQIDTGRIGGITPAKRVADAAKAKGITYVNHTFTSHLALSASLQPYAGVEADVICEYPVEPKQLALDITANKILPDANGQIVVPEAPGLGVDVQIDTLRPYIVDAEIRVNGSLIYQTPVL